MSTVAEHRFKTAQNKLSITCILNKTTSYMQHVIKEAIKNSLHLRNFNRDWGFNLSQS
jgi:hypothetical protein